MVVTLEEAKAYIRVDSADEDGLLLTLISTSENLCADILRVDLNKMEAVSETVRTAILYGASFLYENRESADFKELTIMLKCLLFSEREDVF